MLCITKFFKLEAIVVNLLADDSEQREIWVNDKDGARKPVFLDA